MKSKMKKNDSPRTKVIAPESAEPLAPEHVIEVLVDEKDRIILSRPSDKEAAYYYDRYSPDLADSAIPVSAKPNRLRRGNTLKWRAVRTEHSKPILQLIITPLGTWNETKLTHSADLQHVEAYFTPLLARQSPYCLEAFEYTVIAVLGGEEKDILKLDPIIIVRCAS